MKNLVLWAPFLLVVLSSQAHAQSKAVKASCDTTKTSQPALKVVNQELPDLEKVCVPLDGEIHFEYSGAVLTESEDFDDDSKLFTVGSIPDGFGGFREFGEVVSGSSEGTPEELITNRFSNEGKIKLSLNAKKGTGRGTFTLSEDSIKLIKKEKRHRLMGREVKRAEEACVSGLAIRGRVTQSKSGRGSFIGSVYLFMNDTEHGHMAVLH